MAFNHRGFTEAEAVAQAEADMWRRRNRAATAAIDHWFADLGLPETRQRCEGAWLAMSNWPGDLLVYWDEADEAAAIKEGRGPTHTIPPHHRGNVVAECGEILANVMERHFLQPLELIALAKGFDKSDAKERAWSWLRHRIDFTGWDEPLDMILPKPSPFISASSFKARPVPAREWVVEALVPDRTVTLLTGDGGTGKSLLAMQLAVAVASGTRWIGRQADEGAVIYLSAEDDMAELHRRLDGILRGAGLTFDDVDSLHLRSTVGEGALMAERGRVGFKPTELARQIEEFASDRYTRLIVLDTLANLFPGDENDRAQVTQFVDIVKGIALRCDCAAMVLAHPSKSAMESGDGYSGSTAWNGAVRSRLFFKRVVVDGYEADPDARVLRTMKANYGPVGGEIGLTYCDGAFVPEASETTLDRMAGAAKAERVFLKLLRMFAEQGRRMNHAGGPTYAPKVFSEHPDSEGMTKRALRAAMESLLASGKITVVEAGPASKRRTYLEVAE